MMNGHKVGRNTDFGILVAEALIWDEFDKTVAIYVIDHKSPYMAITWDISDETAEIEIEREYFPNDGKAMEFFMKAAFQVSL